jgi:cation:H+ antiporter
LVWLEFFFCTAIILVSGGLLSRYGDMLAEKTGMGHTWIGLILLASVTSFPELITGLSSVTVAAVPDIAVGDVLGSCVFNLMLIGLIDLFHKPGPILSRVDRGHIVPAVFGILIIGFAALNLLLSRHWDFAWGFWAGPYTPLILIFYVAAMRWIFLAEQRRMGEQHRAGLVGLKFRDVPIQRIYRNVGIHSIVIIGAGTWLPFIGSRIADETGWGSTFVGNLFVAAATSLPEIVTSLSALRLGVPDLAVANLLGSNLFNIAVLAVDDLAFVKGFLLSEVSSYHLISAVTSLLMTGIVICALSYRAQRKAGGPFSWYTPGLFALYLLNAFLLFTFVGGMAGK